jgi:hypothetical protein
MALLRAEQIFSLCIGSSCCPTGQFQGSEYANKLKASCDKSERERDREIENSRISKSPLRTMIWKQYNGLSYTEGTSDTFSGSTLIVREQY